MENKELNQESFSYTYSAKEQEEIKKIRQKYASDKELREETSLDRLRAIDRRVNAKAETVALVAGILGALIMGFGMSLVMSDIASILRIANPILWGVIIGVVGIVAVALAYPIYSHVIRKEREKVRDEVIRLSDELMK